MDIFAYLEETHRISLNLQQREAVLADEGNILLLAVPGSGKTTVLVTRIARLLLEKKAPPERILTITFNRETARDMKGRFLALFGSLPEAGSTGRLPVFATIHSFCLSVLKYYAAVKHRRMPQMISQAGEDRKGRVLREIYRKHTGEFLADDQLETLERLMGLLKNTMSTPEEMSEQTGEIASFPEIYRDYESYKRENRLIDFDDMLTLALDVFTKFPDILEHYRNRFDFINVDEAQDTSLIQHRLIQLISGDAALFMVGDEDQSIYSFRGACPGELLEFARRYERARIIKMEENFRSGQEIVRHANRFIKQNKLRYDKEMVSQTGLEGEIELLSLEDYAMQYRRTLELLQTLPSGKTAAVLYKNNESAIPLMDLFEREGFPFYVREHRLTYFHSAVVRDVIAYILLAADGRDVDSFGKIYYKLGYSRGVYEYVKERIREYDSVFDCILSISSLPAYRKGFTRRYREGFSALFRMKPASAIDFIVNELNYGDFLENRISSSSARTGAYQKLNTAKCLGQGQRSVFAFLDRLEELEHSLQNRENIQRDAAVTLSTLHSSKGLEFDWVILLDMLENILPSSEAADGLKTGSPLEYENEVRLFYVGATRAKERLTLFRSNRMNGADAPPSVFLKDFTEGTAARDQMTGRGKSGAAPRPR